jgi:hypothetical protein
MPMLAVWAAAALKMIAAVLPLLARHRFTRTAWNRVLLGSLVPIWGLLVTVALLRAVGVVAAKDHDGSDVEIA